MSTDPTMQDVGEWLREIKVFAVAVGASEKKRAEITVSQTYPMTLEAADGTLTVTCERELPPEAQGVIEMLELQQAASAQARTAAMPTIAETKEVGGKQWASFRIPLHLDGLTRNELAAAIWEVWKAQEFVALQIGGFKELEALTSEMEELEAEAEAPPPETVPAEVAPPPVPPAAPEAEATPPPEPAAAPEAAPAGRFCSNCGQQAKPEHGFCIGCGTALQE